MINPVSNFAIVPVLGQDLPMNTWGHVTAILSMLYREGHLPDLRIYGTNDPEHEGMYFINGEPVGKTTDEVLTAVWKMMNCYKVNGYLFED